MSTHSVTRCFVACDVCGAERPGLSKDATMARIEAAAEGWKYIKYEPRPGQPDPKWRTRPRAADACPKCPLPATPEEAERVRSEQPL